MITAPASAVRSLAVVTLLALVVFAVSCAGSTSSPLTSTSTPATSLGGAAGDWPSYHHDSARTGASSDQGG
jgi:hypothetical protein